MENLLNPRTHIKSRGLLTWVCLMGIQQVYPCLCFQASEESKDYGPKDLEAREVGNTGPRRVESIYGNL
jgi:hypothetical protein